MAVNTIDSPLVNLPQVSETQHASINAYKAQSDITLIASSVDVSISAGRQPMNLVMKSVMEHVSSALFAELKDNIALKEDEKVKEQTGLAVADYTPEKVADRIVDFATGFFDAYRDANPDMDDETALDRFLELIGKGVDKGFEEARNILDGLTVLEGEVSSNIDQTYSLVQSGFTDFKEKYLNDLKVVDQVPDKA